MCDGSDVATFRDAGCPLLGSRMGSSYMDIRVGSRVKRRADGARPTDKIHQTPQARNRKSQDGRICLQRLNLYAASANHTHPDVRRSSGTGRRTLLHKLGALDPPPDLGLVPHLAVRHEGAVQARAEVGEAEGVLAAEEEELCVRSVGVRRMKLIDWSWGAWGGGRVVIS